MTVSADANPSLCPLWTAGTRGREERSTSGTRSVRRHRHSGRVGALVACSFFLWSRSGRPCQIARVLSSGMQTMYGCVFLIT